MRLTRRAALALLGAWPAAAQPLGQPAAGYPDRPVRLVVPYLPGGSVDILNRAYARALSEQLGQTVVVENRPGGTTSIGTAYVARATPDGYTLLGGGDSVELNRYLMAQPPYDADRDLIAIQQLADVPYVLIVNPKVPARSLAELVRYGKANPGKLTYASFGIGGGGHLSGELLCRLAGIEALHIPYPGNPPALLDVVAGRVDMMFCTIPVAQPSLRGGEVVALAMSSAARVAALPDVPTCAEAGLDGYDSTGEMTLYAPAGVPGPIVARLWQATRAALESPELVRLLGQQGFVITPPRNPAETARHVKAHAARMAEVIRVAGIRL
jgi:tripartite-type tricarboxylate transporter receptor subunit TctC